MDSTSVRRGQHCQHAQCFHPLCRPAVGLYASLGACVALAGALQAAGMSSSCVDQSSEICEVRAHLVPPPVRPYPFSEGTRGEYLRGGGRSPQSYWVDGVFNGSRRLFAVESGAHDGEHESNTLYLELKRGWHCLLIEANPELAGEASKKRPKSNVLNGGLSISNDVGLFRFFKRGSLGGLLKTMSPWTTSRWMSFYSRWRWRNATGRSHVNEIGGDGRVVDIKCFPLHKIMRALGHNVIDYWSLDTEGSEPDILESTNFSELDIGVLTVEHLWESSRLQRIRQIMERSGFAAVISVGPDTYFASKRYFRQRGLAFPTCSSAEKSFEQSPYANWPRRWCPWPRREVLTYSVR